LEMGDPPAVVSISYGADEYEWGEKYCERANEAFGKLALLGTTVFASSGDDGALGDDSDCHDNHYTASFPASATYVTAVGGTLGGSWESLQENGTTDEIAWADSGGAFSQYFEISDYQKNAVFNYFHQGVTYPDSDHYELGMRGVPDISAQAVEYIIAYEGAFYTVSGTSCSSPTVAGMFASINMKRESEEKAKLGFLNPVLYQMYDDQADDYNTYFNDVTAGYNEGCSDDDSIAFYAASGWDPITGCGTPKFDKILAYMTYEVN
jgi:tripeptidyl-peptidase-1